MFLDGSTHHLSLAWKPTPCQVITPLARSQETAVGTTPGSVCESGEDGQHFISFLLLVVLLESASGCVERNRTKPEHHGTARELLDWLSDTEELQDLGTSSKFLHLTRTHGIGHK
jgi:hypothetical protein